LLGILRALKPICLQKIHFENKFLQDRLGSVLSTDSFGNLFDPIFSYSFGVLGIFYWHNPSDRTMALGPTQPLTAMSIMNIFWGVKAVRMADNLTTTLCLLF